MAGIVGCILLIVLSTANAILSVLTRMMQSIDVSVMMVYIALISISIILPALLIEAAFTEGPIRF